MSARAWILAAIASMALPAAAARADTGVLRITSIPSRAEVWLDGVSTGRRTPSRFVLEEGTYTVTLVLPGGAWQPATEAVTVEPGRNTLRLVMAPATDGLDELAELLGLLPEELTVPARAIRSADCLTAQVGLSVGGTALGEPVGLFGHEGISELSRFVVAVDAGASTIDVESLIGEDARLDLRANADGGSLVASGIVTRAELAAAVPGGKIYVLTLEPALTRLERSRGYAFLQGSSSPEIVERLLEEEAVPVTFALNATYPVYEVLAQANESDLDFVNRLLEDEGIFYFFGEDGVARVGDTNAAFPSGPGLPYRGHFPPGLPAEALASSFRSGRGLVSGEATVAGFDPAIPGSVFGSASQPVGIGELFTFDGRVNDAEEAERRAAMELRRASLALEPSSGTSNAAGVRAGRIVTIDGAGGAFSGAYLVTEVTHTLSANEGCFDYGNRFEAIPAATPFVPPRRTPRPSGLGLLTALVEQVDPALGRVRVRFPWDRTGEGESAWIRLGHPVGRNDEAFIPEVDDEVVVGFVQGDLRQPIVIGGLWNGKDRPPPQ